MVEPALPRRASALTGIAFKCIHEDVLRAFFHLRIFGSILTAFFLAAGLAAHADKPPAAPPGYKMVPVKQGGHTAYIQVRDSGGSGSDKNNPAQIGFTATSSMAHKSYLPETASSSADGAYQDKMQSTFLTKSYFPAKGDNGDDAMPGLHSAVAVTSAEGYDHAAAGFDRSFESSRNADEQNRSAEIGTKTASESGRTAILGGHDVKKFAYTDSNKVYAGPEAAMVKRDLDKMNSGLESMKDLPSRPLTIDEVRALINHGVKPNLDEKPPEASKPLNDPGYLPDPAPAPVRGPDRINLKDDPDDVPPPGMMAHPDGTPEPPENSQPLPQ
jgi:hypothetical protein